MYQPAASQKRYQLITLKKLLLIYFRPIKKLKKPPYKRSALIATLAMRFFTVQGSFGRGSRLEYFMRLKTPEAIYTKVSFPPVKTF
ncbi:MAG: hypothetical protein EA344_10090 [Alkalicoccus sp.]|nr:MAG: hypothetical protein EA344_10090 [Alkalicoccus sp.]